MYPDIPYQTRPVYQTSPDHLAATATLFGLQPAPVERCRVLELGCSDGGNLIPLAVYHPDSQFIGLDLSAPQVARGQRVVATLGLTNIDLRAMDILAVTEAFGAFDYLIAHGIYSWVPPEVRTHTLALCSRLLTPQGLAYVSANVYPAWHAADMLREMLHYHARGREAVAASRELAGFLAQAIPEPEAAFGKIIREETRRFLGKPDWLLCHDDLNVLTAPCTHSAFHQQLAAHGLQHLAEADCNALPSGLRPGVVRTLAGWSTNQADFTQYVDFFSNRRFRQSVICRAGGSRRPSPDASAVARLRISSLLQPSSPNPDILSAAPEAFVLPDGSKLTVRDPQGKAALLTLSDARPQSLSLTELQQRIRSRAGIHADEKELAGFILEVFLAGMIRLHTHVPAIATEVTQHPCASALARLQATSSDLPANAYHQGIELTEGDRAVLCLLDGQRDRAVLLQALAGKMSAAELDETLRRLAESALLVA